MTGASLLVLDCGPATSLQDGGRRGYLRYGLSGSGPMDRLALAAANALVGNAPDAAAIEFGMGGGRVRVEGGSTRVALAGAPCPISLDGAPVAAHRSLVLREGVELRVDRPREGAFAYLAVSGGFAMQLVMGSVSLHLRAALGGLDGRTLRAEDRLPLRDPTPSGERALMLDPVPLERDAPLRIVLGPQDDRFTKTGLDTLLGQTFIVSNRADRMGYQLDGPEIAHRDGFNIVSDATVAGSIQVPGSGRPIILLADRQTTGGYPKIATVISADLRRVAAPQDEGRGGIGGVGSAMSSSRHASNPAAPRCLPMTQPQPRLGFCCKFIPDVPPGHFKTKKAAQEAALAMNTTSVTMAYLNGLAPAARRAKLEAVIRHNLAAQERQIEWVAARPPLERLLRMASSLLPGYTHPVAQPLYAEPELARLIRDGLARIGERARAGGVRLSMHPGPFCVIGSRNPAAQANGISELDYHAEVMAMLGFGSGWHPHGAHLNIHVGARDPGIDGYREGLSLVSETARNLVTVENDENFFGLDAVLKLADTVPVVLDLHHHWVESRGQYIEPDDPRIATIKESWRGVRPVAHVSVSRESVLADHDPVAAPDFAALSEAGHSWRDLAAHSDLMWNAGVNDLVARHLAWADFEVEAKHKNLASVGLAAYLAETGRFADAA